MIFFVWEVCQRCLSLFLHFFKLTFTTQCYYCFYSFKFRRLDLTTGLLNLIGDIVSIAIQHEIEDCNNIFLLLNGVMKTLFYDKLAYLKLIKRFKQ